MNHFKVLHSRRYVRNQIVILVLVVHDYIEVIVRHRSIQIDRSATLVSRQRMSDVPSVVRPILILSFHQFVCSDEPWNLQLTLLAE